MSSGVRTRRVRLWGALLQNRRKVKVKRTEAAEKPGAGLAEIAAKVGFVSLHAAFDCANLHQQRRGGGSIWQLMVPCLWNVPEQVGAININGEANGSPGERAEASSGAPICPDTPPAKPTASAPSSAVVPFPAIPILMAMLLPLYIAFIADSGTLLRAEAGATCLQADVYKNASRPAAANGVGTSYEQAKASTSKPAPSPPTNGKVGAMLITSDSVSVSY